MIQQRWLETVYRVDYYEKWMKKINQWIFWATKAVVVFIDSGCCVRVFISYVSFFL